VRISAVLATTPNDLLSDQRDRQQDAVQVVHDRIAAATSVLPSDDLERVAIMIEALASARMPRQGLAKTALRQSVPYPKRTS
jgi:hypothetical protein